MPWSVTADLDQSPPASADASTRSDPGAARGCRRPRSRRGCRSAVTSWPRSPQTAGPRSPPEASVICLRVGRGAGSGRRPRRPPRPRATGRGVGQRLVALQPGQVDQVLDQAGQPGRPRAASARRTGGPPRGRRRRPSTASASSDSAPTGVFSSWLTLATKSRRTASTRRASVQVLDQHQHQPRSPAGRPGRTTARASPRPVPRRGRSSSTCADLAVPAGLRGPSCSIWSTASRPPLTSPRA